MKKLHFILTVATLFIFSSCSHTMSLGYKGHNYAEFNLGKRIDTEEYRIVKSVSGEAKAVYVFGIGGLSAESKRLNDASYKDMTANAHLKPNQAIINVTSESKISFFLVVAVRTIHTTGIVVEFIDPKQQTIDTEQKPQTTIVESGKTEPTIKDSKEEAVTTPIAPVDKSTYKIGDICKIDGVKGVVISVSDNGKHGKAIYYTGARRKWAKELVDINNPDNYYPAELWCTNRGESWYLPTAQELKDLFANLDIVNATLTELGMFPISKFETYWTSSIVESDRNSAIAIYNGANTVTNKTKPAQVIAMAKF